jgi:hypothetical protein
MLAELKDSSPWAWVIHDRHEYHSSRPLRSLRQKLSTAKRAKRLRNQCNSASTWSVANPPVPSWGQGGFG